MAAGGAKHPCLALTGNILWVVFGGIIFFLLYIILGFALCLTLIGIPFGLQIFKLAIFAFLPFGKKVISTSSANGVLAILMNIIWFLIGGFVLALFHIIFGVIMAITIIGIPFAKQHFKLAQLIIFPFGKQVVEDDVGIGYVYYAFRA
eukprot:TRINITY_DN12491_c0_g1_i1.p1 TRINITY_DN12491_c0_g1~~TRINITY_DN12491_c0_g1_i1.p1  ORF type:complete len:158 (+),score=38.72 TRINITY_DN12491_c0_g1_i1:32-475(+)